MGINLKAQDRRSTSPQWKENLISVSVFKADDTSITLDSFDGLGNELKEPQLRISNEGKVIFNGSFAELEKRLGKKVKQK